MLDNNRCDFIRYVGTSTECLDAGECVKLHKTLVNSGCLRPWSQIPGPLFLSNPSAGLTKGTYSLSTFSTLRAYNFLTEWSFAVIFTRNTTTP